jgi:hypothetical protein
MQALINSGWLVERTNIRKSSHATTSGTANLKLSLARAIPQRPEFFFFFGQEAKDRLLLCLIQLLRQQVAKVFDVQTSHDLIHGYVSANWYPWEKIRLSTVLVAASSLKVLGRVNNKVSVRLLVRRNARWRS